MTDWWFQPILFLAAYLVGSIPWGLIVVRLAKNVDVRHYGSQKTGMTNVLRTAGKIPAILVLVADAGKGIVMILVAKMFTDDAIAHTSAACALLIGHVWPIFAGFRGGRGVATGLGASVALAPWSAFIGIALFLPILVTTRYVSLSSLGGSLGVIGCFLVLATTNRIPDFYLVYAGLGGMLIFLTHRDNIQRLLQGTERRIGNPQAPDKRNDSTLP